MSKTDTGELSMIRVGNKFAFVDMEDHDFINQFRWRLQKALNAQYARTEINGKTVMMHRLILGVPEGKETHHLDGNGLNNKRENLVAVNPSQNQMARRNFKGPTKYKGVQYDSRKWRRKRWVATIRKDYKRTRLGYFNTPEEAAQAYDLAAREAFGEFAMTNKDMGLL